MNLPEHNILYQRTEDEVTEIRKTFGLTEKSINEGVTAIMEWFEKQPHLVRAGINRYVAEIMIIISKGSIETAKEKIDKFYKYRCMMPEFIQNREEILCRPTKIWDMFSVVPLPKLQDNRRIMITKFGPEMKDFDILEFFRRVFMLTDLRMRYDYIAGDIWIIDFGHVGWAQVLTQNPLIIKKMSNMFTKALNWRIFGIHCVGINASAAIIQRVVNFFKQFLTSVIMERVVIHENVADLYKYIPRNSLPEDYGGDAPSVQKLTEISENEYRKPEITKYLLECCKVVSDESLRPLDKDSEEFLAGSFRKLEVD